jgi:photoactive yellow protein
MVRPLLMFLRKRPLTEGQQLLSPEPPMDATVSLPAFNHPDLGRLVAGLSDDELDQLDFGVIGIDGEGLVRLYNSVESKMAGLSRERVIGFALFTVVAPCMNNYLVAQRFEDAQAAGEGLDATMDYVFTLRMRPVKVKLRLLAGPQMRYRYVIVSRRA